MVSQPVTFQMCQIPFYKYLKPKDIIRIHAAAPEYQKEFELQTRSVKQGDTMNSEL